MEHEEERGELVQNRGGFGLDWLCENGRSEGEGMLLWEEEGIVGFESYTGFFLEDWAPGLDYGYMVGLCVHFLCNE